MKNKLKKLSRIWFHKIRLGLYRRLGFRSVRAADGPMMKACWTDATFWFCAASMYDPFLKHELLSRSSDYCFIDIGSNQGFYSLIASLNNAAKQIYAFEPVPEIYEVLKENINLNRPNKINAFNLAISEKSGQSTISMNSQHTGLASMRAVEDAPDTKSVEISSINGVELSRLIDPHYPTLIKVDVEGLEDIVISELVGSRWFDQVYGIFYEVDSRWSDAIAIESMLRSAGFSDFHKVGLVEDHYDIFATRSETFDNKEGGS